MNPNYELLLKSAIYGKQEAYRKYKQAAKDALEYTFINQDGEVAVLDGQEKRNQIVIDCWDEVERFTHEIKRIRNEIAGVKI